MSGLTQHGANVLGQRVGALFNGTMAATTTLVFDRIMPSWCKVTYVVVGSVYRAFRSDKSFVASKASWRVRLPVCALWLAVCAAYLIWAPTRRLLTIYHGVTGQGANIIIWTLIVLQNDGPMNELNKIQSAFLDGAFSFLVTSYTLTHRAQIWSLITTAFFRAGIPSLCLGIALYYLREKIPVKRTVYKAIIYIFTVVNKSWDHFDYVEAHVVERLPRYLQHRWSSYQQGRARRAKLPRYQYKPLNPGEIRLLIIKQSPLRPSVIRAEIVHVPVDPPPDYEAVSYRWGSSELTDEVIVDGCRFPVTKSAFDLLLARRSVWRDRTIWIDALCINQQDTEEKTHQVHLMRDIYHRASRVVAFPGGGWRSRLAGPLIYQMWGMAYQYETETMDWTDTPDEARSPRWRATADLFSNEYFNRAWVIQEIAVGKKVELYIGGTYIPWMIFADVLNWTFNSKRRHMLTGSDTKEKRTWRTGRTCENVAVMTTLRPDAEEWVGSIGDLSRLINLENLVYLTFNFQAADPRDKVFGLVGIARGTGDSPLLTPDYSLPVEQVFQNAARVIFSLPKERRPIHVLALAGTGFSEKRWEMPSWVPDFSEERLSYPMSDVLERNNSFKASGDIPQDIKLDDETNSLIVKAYVLDDEISELSEFGVLDWGLKNHELVDTFKLLRLVHAFVHAAIDLCRKHFESPEESIRERLWSALIAGRVERGRDGPRFKEVFPHWLAYIDLITGARDRDHCRQLLSDGALGDGQASLSDGTGVVYQHSFLEACLGRRFAITASGRLCTVPPLTKVGDSVIIPFGAQIPFLVRQRHDLPGDISYELVGETFVEGVMDGEMIGHADEQLIRLS